MISRRYVIWGSDLSPFALKVVAIARFAGLTTRMLPVEGATPECVEYALRVERVKRGRLEVTYPELTPLDELASVPYIFGEQGERLYDSSAFGDWADIHFLQPGGKLVPDDEVLRFAIRLIDDYFDHFGLYMVHHNRWVTSAFGNDAGERLAGHFKALLLPGTRGAFARWFSARQTRRLPYLFSVAETDPAAQAIYAELPAARRPPARDGFPPTHDLLDDAFARMLAAVEGILSKRPFLFGERFTLADAAAYGQLCMNSHDREAEALIARRAPRTREWIARIESGRFEAGHACGSRRIGIDATLEPLIEEICRTYVPLMRANEAAFERALAAGQGLFNEAAFDAGQSLFDGTIGGQPYRSVVKTFQVSTWRDLLDTWTGIGREARAHFPQFAEAIDKPL